MKNSLYPYAPLREVRPSMLASAAFIAGCYATPPRSDDADQKYQVMVDLEQRLTQDLEAVAVR